MYDALLERCREQFIASNAIMFRSLLTEYRDHKMLVNRETDDGEILVIPMQKDAILGVISWLNEK
ncbi:hypothetical protein HK098_005135 [Nowakowskiella sp. JEL0407]|nr:hypothetical protein HK098_005135 [Nowakowskiella sp. JEL0407]